MTDTSYPDAWKLALANTDQRFVIRRAHGRCQLGYAGCISVAVTTNAALATDPIASQRACCQSCADRKHGSR